MTMKFACIIAATSISAFVPQPKGKLHHLPQHQKLAANPANNNDKEGGRPVVTNNNLFFDNVVMGVLLPDELPSLSNLIHEFLKDEMSIESVEDFDVDLANEIEVALAMAEETDGDVAGGLVNDVDCREQPPPLNIDTIASSTNKVETTTASASNAWIDNNMKTYSNHTLLNQEQYSGYPQEEKVREHFQKVPFFANIPEQAHARSKGIPQSNDNNNASDYIADGPTFHNNSNEENWSITTNNDDENSNHIQFVAAAQLLADHSIRIGLERKSVEESYKLYQQYFEKEGVSSTILLLDDGGMNNI